MRTLGCRAVFLKAVKTAYSNPGCRHQIQCSSYSHSAKTSWQASQLLHCQKKRSCLPSAHRRKKADVTLSRHLNIIHASSRGEAPGTRFSTVYTTDSDGVGRVASAGRVAVWLKRPGDVVKTHPGVALQSLCLTKWGMLRGGCLGLLWAMVSRHTHKYAEISLAYVTYDRHTLILPQSIIIDMETPWSEMSLFYLWSPRVFFTRQ